MNPEVVLFIGGSDPSGGAGIQTDIKTAVRLGVYPCSVLTSLTAQNSSRIDGVWAVDSDIIKAQLKSVLSDFKPSAVKIGLLRSVEAILYVVEAIEEYRLQNVVVDPVLSLTLDSGTPDGEFISTLVERLFPLAVLVTPNLPEKETIEKVMGGDFGSLCNAFLLKGGHAAESYVIADVLYTHAQAFNPTESPSSTFPTINFNHSGNYFHDSLVPDPVEFSATLEEKTFTHRRIPSGNTHGTGCMLSSAITCYLARDYDLQKAVKKGIDFTHEALKKSLNIKITSGPYGPSQI